MDEIMEQITPGNMLDEVDWRKPVGKDGCYTQW